MKAIFVTFLAIVALWTLAVSPVFTQAQTTIPNCGAFGVDLSPISSDIVLNVTNYVYIVHPCGRITDPGCLNDSTANNSMVCQRGSSNSYSLSDWNTSSVIYTRDANGLYQQLITGELCASTPRQSLVYYQCDASATTPVFVSVVETTTCVYAITIRTNLTCALTRNNPCVFDGVDLNPMFAEGDLNITASGFIWFVHMCASSTSNALCRNDSTANTSMVCQQRLDGSDSFGIAIYNESNVQWQIIPTGNNAGLLLTVYNGEYCAAVSRNRIARFQMICDPTLSEGSSYIYGVSEVSTCTYQFTIRTSLSCSVVQLTSSTGPGIALSSSWWPSTTTSCTFNGYNLSPMTFNPDLYWGGFVNNVFYDFWYHMCGVTRNRQCLTDSSTYNSMLCQASVTNANDNFALDYYVPSAWNWTTTQYGIQYVSYLGEFCGTRRRATTVNFICDTGLTRIFSLVQDPVSQCDINVVIKTPLVCNGTNLPPQPPECVYNGWDFKRLTPPDMDIQMSVIGSTNYTISVHMCSEVAYQPCKRDITATKSMVCQTRNSDLQSYSLGDYAPNQQNWTEIADQQIIQMTIGSGELCGSTPRRSVVDFKCDLSYQAQTGNGTAMVLFNETSSCVYHIVIVYNDLVCAYFNGSNFNLTHSSSSSSSTGISSSSSSRSDNSTGSTGAASSSGSANSGCLSGDSIPDGAVEFSFVLNGAVNVLPANASATILQALTNALSINSSQLACGTIVAGTRVASVVNATTTQSVFTFYILPGAVNVSTINTQLINIVNNPTALNAALPNNIPPVVQGQYNSVVCPDGQFPDQNGICQSKDSGSDGLSDGAIAGIVVGSVVGGLLLIAICVFLLMRTRKGSSSEGKNVEMGTR